MKIKRPIEDMLPIVDYLLKALGPKCTRLAVAGSIRRGKALVGDIELVAQPAGDDLERWLGDWLRMGRISQRKKSNGHLLSWGPRYKAFEISPPPTPPHSNREGSKIPVDLFMVLPDRQWGPTFLIRTGPGQANEALVTHQGRQNRNGDWGLLPDGLKFRDGGVWKSPPQTPPRSGREGLIRLDTPEEVDVFGALDLPYVPPPLRSYELYRALDRGEPMEPFDLAWLDGRDDMYINGRRKVLTVPVAKAADVVTVEQPRLF